MANLEKIEIDAEEFKAAAAQEENQRLYAEVERLTQRVIMLRALVNRLREDDDESNDVIPDSEPEVSETTE